MLLGAIWVLVEGNLFVLLCCVWSGFVPSFWFSCGLSLRVHNVGFRCLGCGSLSGNFNFCWAKVSWLRWAWNIQAFQLAGRFTGRSIAGVDGTQSPPALPMLNVLEACCRVPASDHMELVVLMLRLRLGSEC